MAEGVQTMVGTGGLRLSGGQQQRLALARTLVQRRPILILDDPFSALDRTTEEQVFTNLKTMTQDSIVLLSSHRLYLFSQLDQVIWMDGQQEIVGSHETLMQSVPEYAKLYHTQEGVQGHER